MLELVFTSAKTGLIPGRSGFCSVAWTEGMPQNLVTLLENMSGYNTLYMPNDPKADLNPVCYSYQHVQYGQNTLWILSRIAFAGLDYTGRTNKIAHHIIIEAPEELAQLQHGPVSAFLCEENFITEWNEPPRLLPRRRTLKSAHTDGLCADRWHELTGKPQWAGVVVDSFLARDEKSCLYLEYDNEEHRGDVLFLIDEIARLLPRDMVAGFTFNTYFSNAQNGVDCFFRAVLPNCPALPAVKRFKAKDLISLITETALPESAFGTSDAITTAVTGNAPVKQQQQQQEQPQVHYVFTATQGVPAAEAPEENIQVRPRSERMVIGKTTPATDNKKTFPDLQDSMSPRARLILFSTVALLLFALIGIGVWFANAPQSLDDKNDVAENDVQQFVSPIDFDKMPSGKETEKSKQADDPMIETVTQTAENETKSPDAAVKENEVKEKKTTSEPEKKIAAEEKKTKAPAPSPRLTELLVQDSYALFKGYLKLDRGNKKIVLPGELCNATNIQVVLSDEKWPGIPETMQFQPNEFLSSAEPAGEITVYSVEDELADEWKPDKAEKKRPAMRIALDSQNGLLIIDDSACRNQNYTPRREYIKSITFYTEKKYYIWRIQWNDAFLKEIPTGSFDKKTFEYQRHAEEVLFKDYFTDNAIQITRDVKVNRDGLVKCKKELDKLNDKLKKEKALAKEKKEKKNSKDGKKETHQAIIQYNKFVEYVKEDNGFEVLKATYEQFYGHAMVAPESVFEEKLKDDLEAQKQQLLKTCNEEDRTKIDKYLKNETNPSKLSDDTNDEFKKYKELKKIHEEKKGHRQHYIDEIEKLWMNSSGKGRGITVTTAIAEIKKKFSASKEEDSRTVDEIKNAIDDLKKDIKKKNKEIEKLKKAYENLNNDTLLIELKQSRKSKEDKKRL